ncbi:MAG: patatin family protein [Bacteroidaceae bacterium]|nr:patatin family protein [Bacteroidaceae bacterium]
MPASQPTEPRSADTLPHSTAKTGRVKHGLVLEGGGMRGMFTCGILDVMLEHGLRVDGAVGVSAGAAFGVNYKSRQIGRALRYNCQYGADPRYMGLRSLLTTGNLVNADFAYRTVPLELDKFDEATFEADPMEFHLVCTDVDRGMPVYHQLTQFNERALDWIRASASMPIVSTAVEIDGLRLLDGGIVDSIPLRFFQEKGYRRNIVILTQPRGFFKSKTKLMPLFHVFCRRYPAVVQAMARRHEMYNAELQYISEQEALGDTLLIYPEEPITISRTASDARQLRAVYQMGRQKGEVLLPKICAFLGQE